MKRHPRRSYLGRVKAVIVRKIALEMMTQRITRSLTAELMKTGRTRLDRLLDPDDESAKLKTLMRAARVGRELWLELAKREGQSPGASDAILDAWFAGNATEGRSA